MNNLREDLLAMVRKLGEAKAQMTNTTLAHLPRKNIGPIWLREYG